MFSKTAARSQALMEVVIVENHIQVAPSLITTVPVYAGEPIPANANVVITLDKNERIEHCQCLSEDSKVVAYRQDQSNIILDIQNAKKYTYLGSFS